MFSESVLCLLRGRHQEIFPGRGMIFSQNYFSAYLRKRFKNENFLRDFKTKVGVFKTIERKKSLDYRGNSIWRHHFQIPRMEAFAPANAHGLLSYPVYDVYQDCKLFLRCLMTAINTIMSLPPVIVLVNVNDVRLDHITSCSRRSHSNHRCGLCVCGTTWPFHSHACLTAAWWRWARASIRMELRLQKKLIHAQSIYHKSHLARSAASEWTGVVFLFCLQDTILQLPLCALPITSFKKSTTAVIARWD